MAITDHVEPDLDPVSRLAPGQLTRLVIVRELISADIKDVDEMSALVLLIEGGAADDEPAPVPVRTETPVGDEAAHATTRQLGLPTGSISMPVLSPSARSGKA